MRSQTSTEYLIITAVVIIIAVLVLGVLGGSSFSQSETLSNLEYRYSEVGIGSFSLSLNGYQITLHNNANEAVQIYDIFVNEDKVGLDGQVYPIQLNPGASIKSQFIALDNDGTLAVQINYTKLKTTSSFIESYTLQYEPNSQDVFNGVVGYWSFDNNNGSEIGDSSGQASSGTLAGGAEIQTSNCRFGSCYYGDGDNSRMNGINDTIESLLDQQFSFAVWLNSDERSAIKDIFGTESAITISPGWVFRYQSGNIFFIVNNGTGDVYVGAEPQSAGWNHYIGTCDGSICRFYINGSLEGSNSNVVSDYSSDNLFEIGMIATSSRAYEGLMDEVVFWDRALTQEEASAVFNFMNP